MVATKKATSEMTLTVPAPDFRELHLRCVGTAPLCVHKFSKKAREKMAEAQRQGNRRKSNNAKEPRDFARDYEEAFYRSTEGWYGFPAGAFRSAMISACRTAGITMTHAKLAVFVMADGIDEDVMTPLVRIHGTPRRTDMAMRNQTGVADIRVRPVWDEWYIDLRIRFDAGMISPDSVVNLLARAGMQVGIGEGRPDSSRSSGCGWGLYEVQDGNGKPPSKPKKAKKTSRRR